MSDRIMPGAFKAQKDVLLTVEREDGTKEVIGVCDVDENGYMHATLKDGVVSEKILGKSFRGDLRPYLKEDIKTEFRLPGKK